MGIKTAGSGGMGIFDRDVKKSSSRIGKQASRLAKAKKGGAGIGGLLGAIAVPLLAVALAPVTGGASLVLGGTLGAAVGGGLGSLAGSKIGGATSGVDQGDIMGNKFFKKSSADIATGIAQAEFGDVLKGTVSGAMNAGTYADMGKSAMNFGKSVKDIGLGSTLKGYGKNILGKEGMVQGALKGGEGAPSILDITKKLGPEGPGNVVGGVAEAGGESLLSRAYGGADKFLGGALPGAEKLSMESLGGAFGGLPGMAVNKMQGLLGSQTGQDEYSGAPTANAGFELPDSGGGGENPFGSSEELLNFQKMYNEQMGGGTLPISEDGSWGPESQGAYETWKMNQ